MKKVPSLIVLNLTTDCNLRCDYCYASAGEKRHYMTSECAIRIVSEVAKNNKRIEILFHGGEPLLVFRVIKDVINNCKNNLQDKDIHYYIQTNSLLLTLEKAKYLIENGVEICISMDGNSMESNGGRIKSDGTPILNIIMKRIDMLKKLGYNTTILSVLSHHNYKEIDSFIDFLVSNNIYNFSFNYFIEGGRGNKNRSLALTPTELFNTTKRIIDRIIFYRKKGINIIERNVFHLLKSIYTEKKEYMCMNCPCGAGNHLLGYTPNGDIYPCDDLSSVEQFKIGNIYDDDLFNIIQDSDIIDFFNYCSYENITKCKKCDLVSKCGAGCASRKFYANNTIYSTDPICNFYKKIIPYIDNRLLEDEDLRELVYYYEKISI